MDRSTLARDVDLGVIHSSLTRPVLWAGVERRVVGIEFLIVVGVFVWRGMTPGALVMVACIVVPLHLIARRIAATDPRMIDLFLRNLEWRRYYPAHADACTPSPPPKPTLPRGP